MSYQFHYRFAGEKSGGDRGKGDQTLPILLFLHGFLGSHADFDRVIEPLSHQFCCLAVDLPGHGQTIVEGAVEQYTMPQTAQALVAWLDQLTLEPCWLVGYSMGGRLALYLALHFPQRFRGALLLSASPGLMNPTERQARLQHDWALADQLEADFPTFLDHWYRQPLFASLRQQPHFEQILAQRSHANPASLATSLRYLSTGNQPPLWDHLAQHTQPLRLLAGAGDRKFCAIHQAMADRCPTAHPAIIPDCGHAIHYEQPTRVIEEIQACF